MTAVPDEKCPQCGHKKSAHNNYATGNPMRDECQICTDPCCESYCGCTYYKPNVDEELDWDIMALSPGTMDVGNFKIDSELNKAKQINLGFVKMDSETRFLHMAAGMKCGVKKTCSRKIRYNTEATATRAANAMNEKITTKRILEPYPCPFCSLWHIGRKMSKEELQRCIEDL